jgi:integrase
LGPRRLIELKTPAFIEFCRARENEGAGPATILKDLSYVGTVLRHGRALMGAEHAVATCITSLEAARRTLRHSGRVAKPDERNRRPTAMRLGEIVGLRWENLDETNRTIIIRERKHPTKKTTNHQKVPLPFGTCTVGGIDPLQIMLKQPSARSRKGRVFPHAAQSVSRAFQRATDDTAIVDLRFHDLRHDGASRLFEAGWPIERVALVTGHRDWNMLRRYTQLRAEDFHRRQSNAEASGQVVPFRAERVTS